MPANPLVSVICTTYNQEAFVKEAIMSVLAQTYPAVELIVIDDSSTDQTPRVVEQTLAGHPEVQYFLNDEVKGLCANFNHGLEISGGKYLIDLSGDDVLFPNRIEEQVAFFEELAPDYGVIYSNGQLINQSGAPLKLSYPVNKSGATQKRPPEGDVYEQLIRRHFVATQTMMMRREVLLELGGYDETLAYEDFDFWIRSSRNWKYAYQDRVLTGIRKREGSLSTLQYQPGDGQLRSTYEVCRKIRGLNQSASEERALISRLKYELRHAALAGKQEEAQLFLKLLSEIQPLSLDDKLFKKLNQSKIETSWLRDAYLKLIH